MDFSAIKDLYIGSTPVQSAWLNGSKVWGRNPAVDEQSIRDAMILWYDLKKQGATNESMAENPVLRDLSGNGHDATCYNFAWGLGSGIGKYQLYLNYYNSAAAVIGISPNKIHITEVKKSNAVLVHGTGKVGTYKFKLNVSGITDNVILYFGTLEEGQQRLIVNGIHEYEITLNEGYTSYGLLSGFTGTCNVTIEELPLYENALVSDGVDDQCLVEGLPLLNKEDGYTVIAKRQFLANKGCLASNRDIGTVHGAFAFEIKELSRTDSFGGLNGVDIEPSSITYQTKSYYNGESINNGKYNSVDTVVLFNLSANNTYFAQCALYSFLLFNRDLTSEEIEWVKTNLIETEQ